MKKVVAEEPTLQGRKRRTNVFFGNLQPNMIVRKFQTPECFLQHRGSTQKNNGHQVDMSDCINIVR